MGEGEKSEAVKYLRIAATYDPAVSAYIKECEEGWNDWLVLPNCSLEVFEHLDNLIHAIEEVGATSSYIHNAREVLEKKRSNLEFVSILSIFIYHNSMRNWISEFCIRCLP